jgi:hypothetical protein
MASLTKKQKSLMSKHGKHHSSKHMQDMTKSMQQGKSFSAAHKTAQKKVGK